ncbi:fibronectin type III domain-containing protein, partial [Desulfothermus sp.]
DINFSKSPNYKKLKKIFKKNPDFDGILTISVYRLSSFNIAFAQYYKMDGEICLYTQEKKLGCWRETATRKKLSIATDPLGAIATVVSSVVSSEGNVNIKNVIFDWAFKISSLIPSFSSAAKKPKILRVVTNVSNSTFKIGDKIMVGLEGTSGGKAYFDVDPLIKKVPMAEVQNGIYKGMYIVREGDSLKRGIIYVHLENEQGERRDWMESSPLVRIDGIPPKEIKDLSSVINKDSIVLKWTTTDTDTTKFEIYRSNKPLSDYKKIAEVSDFSWTDTSVKTGEDYFYRIVSLDKVGNKSKPVQIGPLSLPVFTEKKLPDIIVSNINKGKYFITGTSTIPFGSNVVIGPNVDIEFRNNSTLKVQGNLTIKSSFIHSNDTNSTKKILVDETGNLAMSRLKIQGISHIYVKGNVDAENLYILKGYTGLIIESISQAKVSNSTFRELNTALIIKDGKVKITNCNFERNKLAIKINRGNIDMVYNNFIDNNMNIETKTPIKIKSNFLGSINPSEFRLKGDVEVVSFLSGPYPNGKEITMKELINDAKNKAQEAISFLNKGNYGKAVEIFKKVVPIYSNASIYIYYIYSLSMIQDPSIEIVINKAIEKYPYETRIYQIGIRYFLQINKKEKAKKLLEKGLKLNPNSPTLQSMKVFFNP